MKTYQFIIVIAIQVLFFGALLFAVLTFHPAQTQSFGIAGNDVTYKTATNASVSCPNSTSSLVLGKDPARTSFIATNNSTNTIYLCKASSCTSGTGITLVGNGGAFEQSDDYIGDYSCIANAGTSTLTTATSL